MSVKLGTFFFTWKLTGKVSGKAVPPPRGPKGWRAPRRAGKPGENARLVRTHPSQQKATLSLGV